MGLLDDFGKGPRGLEGHHATRWTRATGDKLHALRWLEHGAPPSGNALCDSYRFAKLRRPTSAVGAPTNGALPIAAAGLGTNPALS